MSAAGLPTARIVGLVEGSASPASRPFRPYGAALRAGLDPGSGGVRERLKPAGQAAVGAQPLGWVRYGGSGGGRRRGHPGSCLLPLRDPEAHVRESDPLGAVCGGVFGGLVRSGEHAA